MPVRPGKADTLTCDMCGEACQWDRKNGGSVHCKPCEEALIAEAIRLFSGIKDQMETNRLKA